MIAHRRRAYSRAALTVTLSLAVLGGARAQETCADASLSCATALAAEAVRRAMDDAATKPFITFSTLATLAFAQRKAGDRTGLDATVALVRARETPKGDSGPYALFLVRYVPGEEGRAMIGRLVAASDGDRARSVKDRKVVGYGLTGDVAALVEAGMKTEAAAYIARQRQAYEPAIDAFSPGERFEYFRSLMVALGAIGERAERDAAARRALGAVDAISAAPADRLRNRAGLLRTMVDAGALDAARALLAELRREFLNDKSFSVFAFDLAVASGDAQARAAEIALMRESRRDEIDYSSGWYVGVVRAHFNALLRAKETALARALYEEVRTQAARKKPGDMLWDGFVGPGQMAASLGDEAGVEAALAGLPTTKRRLEPDAEFRKSMVGYILLMCGAFADQGHAAAYYRCIGKITPDEAKPNLTTLAKQQVELAETLAKR